MVNIDDNRQLVRRYYEEVVNTGDVSKIEEFLSSDYVEVHNNVRYESGLAGARDHVLGVRETYPDLHLTIERQIAEGDWVATVVTARGTHSGVWMGMKPTCKQVEITTVNVDRISDGRIVEHGGAADLFTPLMKIGAICVADPVNDSE